MKYDHYQVSTVALVAAMTTSEEKDIFWYINEAKKVNLNQWLTYNPDTHTYESLLLMAFTPTKTYVAQLLPAQVFPLSQPGFSVKSQQRRWVQSAEGKNYNKSSSTHKKGGHQYNLSNKWAHVSGLPIGISMEKQYQLQQEPI